MEGEELSAGADAARCALSGFKRNGRAAARAGVEWLRLPRGQVTSPTRSSSSRSAVASSLRDRSVPARDLGSLIQQLRARNAAARTPLVLLHR